MMWLVAVQGPVNGTSRPLQPGASCLLGRARDCDLAISSSIVSRRHCLLIPARDSLWVEDLNSTNGTYINDQRVRRARLREGETLRVGDCRFRLEVAVTDDEPSADPALDDPMETAPMPVTLEPASDGEIDEEPLNIEDALNAVAPPPEIARGQTEFGTPPALAPEEVEGEMIVIADAPLFPLDTAEGA